MRHFNAYLAGFIDSDGCITIAKKKDSFTAYLAFRQVRPEAVMAIHKQYGGSLFPIKAALRKRKGKTIKQRKQLGLGLASEVTLCILRDVLPFLKIKRSQAEAVLKAFGDKLSLKKADHLIAFLEQEKKKSINAKTFLWGDLGAVRDFAFSKKQDFRCSICQKPAKAKFLCRKHYDAAWRRGSLPEITQPRRVRVPQEFFYQRQPTLEEQAYLSGVFDGDGNIEIERNKISVRLGQMQAEAVVLMREVYGGAIRQDKRRKQPFAICCLGQQKQVTQFLSDIKPYLLEKREEANLVLSAWSTKMNKEEYTALKFAIAAHRKFELTEEMIKAWRENGVIGKNKQTCWATYDNVMCGKLRIAGNGLCHKHYERYKQYGDPTLVKKQIGRREFKLIRNL